MSVADRKYRRRLPKPLAVDTPQMRAAVNLVIALENGMQPNEKDLDVLRIAFREIFGGKNPIDIFGYTLGLVHPPNKPKDYGFTAADIVSAFIELRRRELLQIFPRNALTKAKYDALSNFVGLSDGDPARAINRDWRGGKRTVEGLSDFDLRMILEPYAIHDK